VSSKLLNGYCDLSHGPSCFRKAVGFRNLFERKYLAYYWPELAFPNPLGKLIQVGALGFHVKLKGSSAW
jgi:hypothetical protein